MRNIYLDNAAATPIDKRVVSEMEKNFKFFGNPSSLNREGIKAKEIIEISRKKIAKTITAKPEELIFTSSGSEANNLAILGLLNNFKSGEVITTPIEHLSVLEPIKSLGNNFKPVFVKVDETGLVDIEDLKNKINKNTKLVSIIYANNEIGTIQSISKIGSILADLKRKNNFNFLFHTDACQAMGCLDINVNQLKVDLMTINSSKIYGPKGIGALFVRKGINLNPIIRGGQQENGLVAGTENVVTITGFAKAVSLIDKKDTVRIKKIRDYFIDGLNKKLAGIKINGPSGDDRLPNNINISIPGTDSENLILELNKHGIYAGSGSACTTHETEPSHVLKAIRVGGKYLDGVLRFSLGRDIKIKDINHVLKVLPKIVKELKLRYKK